MVTVLMMAEENQLACVERYLLLKNISILSCYFFLMIICLKFKKKKQKTEFKGYGGEDSGDDDYEEEAEEDFEEDEEEDEDEEEGEGRKRKRGPKRGPSKTHIPVPKNRPNFYGAVPGVEIGRIWETRMACSRDGVQRPPVAGIHGGTKKKRANS